MEVYKDFLLVNKTTPFYRKVREQKHAMESNKYRNSGQYNETCL